VLNDQRDEVLRKQPQLLLLSTGSKLVSLRLSKPAPNSICGTEQLPKFPIIPVGAALVGAGVEPAGTGVEGTGLWRLDEEGKGVTKEYDTNRRLGRRTDHGAGGWRCGGWVFTITRGRSSTKGLCV